MFGQFPGTRYKLLARQDFADQAEVQGLAGIEGLASEEKVAAAIQPEEERIDNCLLYTSPSPRD